MHGVSSAVNSNTRATVEVKARLDQIAAEVRSNLEEYRGIMEEHNKEVGEQMVKLGEVYGGSGKGPVGAAGAARRKRPSAGTTAYGPSHNKQTKLNEKNETNAEASLPVANNLLPPEKYHNHRIPKAFDCLFDLVDMWEGKGRYKDTPVVGGVRRLDDTFQQKWKRTLEDKERRHFNRVKCIATYLISVSPAQLERYDRIYREKCNRAVATFERHLKKTDKVIVERGRKSST